MSSFYQIHYYQ